MVSFYAAVEPAIGMKKIHSNSPVQCLQTPLDNTNLTGSVVARLSEQYKIYM